MTNEFDAPRALEDDLLDGAIGGGTPVAAAWVATFSAFPDLDASVNAARPSKAFFVRTDATTMS